MMMIAVVPVMMNDLEDYSPIINNNNDFAKQVAEAYDKFWENNQLGYDNEGRIIRTEIKRTRPKEWQQWLFKKQIEKELKDG